MQLAVNQGNGAMLALNGLSIDKVQKLCDNVNSGIEAVISNINSVNQIVVSGEKKSIESIGDQAKLLGAVTIPLKVSAPFHSPLMKPAAIGLEFELNRYTYSKLNYPVMSNVTCKPYLNENEIIPLLTEQVTTVVNWHKIMEYIIKICVNATLEFPPKQTLTKLFKAFKSGITCYSFDQLDEITILSKSCDNDL
jgi:[acyl-carrier-protein] S-malonyltransferase